MSRDINLMMVGSGGTGKTTYLLAMYAVMSNAVKGYTFSAQSMDDDLLLAHLWEELLEQGKWPPPTEQSRSWAFDFNRALKKIKGFNWFDYRGGLLHEPELADPAAKKQFYEKIKESDCVMLCVGGDKLAQYVDKKIPPKGLREFNYLMTHFHKERQATVPVAVVITKADQCRGDRLERGFDKLREQLLSSLFVEGAGWLVMFCPVSLGMRLQSGERPPCLGRIRPHNVHLPVTFAVYFQLEAELRAAARRLVELAGEQDDVQKKVDDLDGRFWSSIFRQEEIASGRERLEALQQVTHLTQEEARQLEQDMHSIRDELIGAKTQIYFDGRRMQLHTE